jgi:hypothetical protein
MHPRYAIDTFAPFAEYLVFQGWFDAPSGTRLELRLGEVAWPITTYGRPSPDVAQQHPGADNVRFDERINIGEHGPVIHRATLVGILPSGEAVEVGDLGNVIDSARQLHGRFAAELASAKPGRFLELGSRARSGLVNNGVVPQGWTYVGMDIHAGPNVDVVGDAHELSSIFPDQKFDAVMSMSVVEHLLMPWKIAIELNQVMNTGGIGLFTTHQAWPLHDAPWDFWRFSRESWTGLFNRATGFEILGAEVAEPGFIVPQRCHAATNFGMGPAYLSSVVLFRKISETKLRWDVSLTDILANEYPAGETDQPV